MEVSRFPISILVFPLIFFNLILKLWKTMAVKNSTSHAILNSRKWIRLHRVYYKLVVQYSYLLLLLLRHVSTIILSHLLGAIKFH